LTSLLRHRFYPLLANHTMLPPCHPPAPFHSSHTIEKHQVLRTACG
jgi:hypothetical protein